MAAHQLAQKSHIAFHTPLAATYSTVTALASELAPGLMTVMFLDGVLCLDGVRTGLERVHIESGRGPRKIPLQRIV